MNTNPVTQKQLDFIEILKNEKNGTSFLSGTIYTYNRIMRRKGELPAEINGRDIHIIPELTMHDRVTIPAKGSLKPSDLIEMKEKFDNYIANYEPKTTREASTIIDILKGNNTRFTDEIIFAWLKENYTVTPELITEGYGKGITVHYIGK
jgi:hypothetical protein